MKLNSVVDTEYSRQKRKIKRHHIYTLFYKNIFYKNIEDEICEIVRVSLE